jgi:hypothetical protein
MVSQTFYCSACRSAVAHTVWRPLGHDDRHGLGPVDIVRSMSDTTGQFTPYLFLAIAFHLHAISIVLAISFRQKRNMRIRWVNLLLALQDISSA